MEQTVTTACDSPPVDPIATSTNSVFTLAVGYCRPSADNPLVMHSNCSSTLIRSKSGQHIVVDTLTPWHRTELLNGNRVPFECSAHTFDPMTPFRS